MKTSTRRISITTDSVRHVVRWKDNSDCHLLQARPIKLRFHLKNAKLDAFEPRICHMDRYCGGPRPRRACFRNRAGDCPNQWRNSFIMCGKCLNPIRAAICDCDDEKLPTAADRYSELAGKKLKRFKDERALFDDKEIDVVSISTQDYWHALQTIWACQAGKDVYVEKPPTWCIAEGRKMVEAAVAFGLRRCTCDCATGRSGSRKT